jgi:prophage regulatory protein
MNHPQKVIRLAELTQFTGLRRTQIALLIAEGRFPRPVRLSARRKCWLAEEIAVWQAERIAERDGNAACTPEAAK